MASRKLRCSRSSDFALPPIHLAYPSAMQPIDLSPELEIRTARSGGKGGQNVNKVETKVEVRWHVTASTLLDETQKAKVLEMLHHRVVQNEWLSVSCSEARTQLENRQLAIRRLNHLVNKALTPVPHRIRTRVPRAVKEKRMADKQHRSLIKKQRRGSA
jgi:ribosome-associated protein